MNICFNKPDLTFPASRKLAELLCECESRMAKCCASIPACTLFATSRKLIERFLTTSKDACRTFYYYKQDACRTSIPASKMLAEQELKSKKQIHTKGGK